MNWLFYDKEIDIIFMYYVLCIYVPNVVSFLWRCFSAFVTGNRVRYASSYSSFSLWALVNICCAREHSVISVGMSNTSSFKSCIKFELKSKNDENIIDYYRAIPLDLEAPKEILTSNYVSWCVLFACDFFQLLNLYHHNGQHSISVEHKYQFRSILSIF